MRLEAVAHYKIISKLGTGGMGEVFLAEDTRLDRKVALKVLPEEFTKDEQRLRRFTQEAKAASALNHPNIITIYDIGQSDSSHFIAAEYVEGDTLRQYIRRSRMSLNEALDIVVQVADALSEAHQAGIIHRDIKPENLIVKKNGLVKLLDFGLAKLAEQQAPSNDTSAPTVAQVNTSPNVILGTLAYMSPEQARGKDIDARTDVFSFGVLLYEMVTGHAPFEGETASDLIAAILMKEPESVSLYAAETPAELQRIISKALRKNRNERYQTMKDLLVDLKSLRKELEFAARPGRSTSPDSSSKPMATNGSAAAVTATELGVTTGQAAASNTSSAEYIVTGIKHHKKLIWLSFMALLLGCIGFYFLLRPTTQKETGLLQPSVINSIAVLPFVNESSNADVEYLSDGMTESLISSLAQLPKLDVRASSSVFRYKGREVEIKRIGQDLAVQAVLTGRIVQRGNDLTFYIELVDTAMEKVLWKADYNRQMTDIVTLQKEIARDVSNRLRSKLSGAEEQRLEKEYTVSAEAYQLYLKGRFFWNKRTLKDTETAVGHFQQAITADTSFSLPFSGIADSYVNMAMFEGGPPAHEVMPKARDAALKAITLDDSLPEAHAALGFVLFLYDYDFAGAEREFKRAIELNPSYETAYQRYSLLLTALGRHEESLAKMRRALEIDPLSLMVNRSYGDRLYDARKHDEAIRQLRKTLELDNNFSLPYSSLSSVYHAQGNYAASVEAIAKAYELTGRHEYATLARESFAKGGWQGYLRAMVEKRADLRAYTRAIYYVGLGEKDMAFAELDKAFENREAALVRVEVDARLDSLRDDPRFQALLSRVGIQQ